MNTCKCGCGQTTSREFKPGHDARYKSLLIETVRTGTQAQRNLALEALAARNWSKFAYTGSKRTFGVELEVVSPVNRDELAGRLQAAGINIEVQSYNHNTQDCWKITSDSSIRAQDGAHYGMEIVSPVLFGQDGFDQIRTLCRVLNAAQVKVNSSCGLHVHHAAHDLSESNIKEVIRTYTAQNDKIDAMMPKSRRGINNQYCMPWLEYELEVLNRENLAYVNGYVSRYKKINLQSYARYGTLEFRQHSGTIDATKIIKWIKFGQTMIAAVKDQKDSNIESFPPAIYNYVQSRTAQLNRAA